MRPFFLTFSLLCILFLAACGSEEELTPPVFSSISASGSLNSTTILTAPSQDDTVTIRGNIDDFSASLVANTTVTGEVPLDVDSSDGNWIFEFLPQEGANTISFTVSDERGNINQMFLTLMHDTTAPTVIAVTQVLNPPQLVVTFSESLLEASVLAESFSIDGVDFIGVPVQSAANTVTLPLTTALSSGGHTLACGGIKDVATPDGNSILETYSFEFTID